MRTGSTLMIGVTLVVVFATHIDHSKALAASEAPQSLEFFVPSNSALTNPCEEGEYLDLNGGLCRQLVKSYGFDLEAFLRDVDTTQFDLTECSGIALESVLDSLPAEGGVVNLPACTIILTESVSLPSNLVLQGSGTGQTIIKADPVMVDDNMLRAKYVQNLVVRDLTVDGSGLSSYAILIWYSANALVERVQAIDTAQSGITFRNSQQITVRYNESSGHTTYHGISSKDCGPDNPAVPDLEECQLLAGDPSPGVLWSRDYAIYSNHLHGNAHHGLACHASEGEIAGNSIHANSRGSKVPDSSLVWFHHNEIYDNADYGLHIYSTLDIPERAPNRIVAFENYFAGNAEYPVRVQNPSLKIYLLFNTYIANNPNEIRVDESEIFVCPGTEDALLEIAGETRKEASNQECDLSGVGSLFDIEPIPKYPLTVAKDGTGSGAVTSPSGGINCGMDCSEEYDEGAMVTLIGIPDTGSTFAGWSGDPDCTDGSLMMDAAKSCTATFDLDCGNNCGPCDFDGTCEVNEDCDNCPSDCATGFESAASCGNGLCEAGDGEDCVSCPEDCNGRQNGKPENRFCCGDGDGQGTIPACESQGSVCNSNGFQCTSAPAVLDAFCCGDAICDVGEHCGNCALDCQEAFETCGDEVDNDCNGLADCADVTCSSDPLFCPSCLPKGEECSQSNDCCSGLCEARGHSTLKCR